MTVYVALEVVAALLLLGLTVVVAVTGWDRYRRRGASPGARPTPEVFIDPETGRRMRVWYDPASGRRDYRED